MAVSSRRFENEIRLCIGGWSQFDTNAIWTAVAIGRCGRKCVSDQWTRSIAGRRDLAPAERMRVCNFRLFLIRLITFDFLCQIDDGYEYEHIDRR